MLPHEWIAAAYFAGLAVAAPFTRVSWTRRLSVIAGAAITTALIVLIASAAGDLVRAWVPHFYLVVGYWMPALLVEVPAHPSGFERWLLRSDQVLRPRMRRMPTALVHATELAYLFCYPLVPISLAVVWTSGLASDVSRFWIAVLIAGYGCYGPLPWLVSRPPRLAGESAHPARSVAAVNIYVLGCVSHELNTFPSGHVAVALAAAAGLMPVSPIAAALVGGAAMAIAVGAVAGRYHYVIDVVLGVAMAAGAVAVAFGSGL